MKHSYKLVKKGLVTPYIITGIVILAVIIFYIFISYIAHKTPNIEATISLREQSKNIESYTKSCLTNLFEDSLITIGLQGGYYNIPQEHFKHDFLKVAYSFNKKPVLLTKDDLKKEISYYIVSNINKYCNFKEFKGLIIDTNIINPNIILENNSTILIPDYIVTVSKKKESIQLKDFQIEIPVRLNLIYDLISLILLDLHRSNINIPSGMSIKIIQFDNSLLYLIFDEQPNIKNMQYKFLFAVKE